VCGTDDAIATLGECHERDTRNVAHANDTARVDSYSQDQTDRTREEHTLKRIATIGAILTTAAIAVPSVAAAGNVAQVKPQVTAQIAGVQVARVQVARVQIARVHRASAAVALQRHAVQLANAQCYSDLLHAQIR